MSWIAGLGGVRGALRSWRPEGGAPQPGESTADPARGPEGDRAPPDLLGRFLVELGLVGGIGHRVAGPSQAVERLATLVRAAGVRRAVMWRHPLLERVGVRESLVEVGIACWQVALDRPDAERLAVMAAADLGITAADYAVADTGTLVLASRPGHARLVSLLPPLHAVVLAPEALLPDLDALSSRLARDLAGPDGPSNIVFVTGPSRTADIELSLTRGVHGPKELHVIAWGRGGPAADTGDSP